MNIHFAPPHLALSVLYLSLITLQVPRFGHLRRSLGEDMIGVRARSAEHASLLGPDQTEAGHSPSNSTPQIFIMQEKCSVGTDIPKKRRPRVYIERRSRGRAARRASIDRAAMAAVVTTRSGNPREECGDEIRRFVLARRLRGGISVNWPTG